jgi:serine/threonine protein kinase
VELSADVLELLRRDDEFLVCRDKPWSVLPPAPVSTRPALESLRLESLRNIEHEYSPKGELDPTRDVRPLALSQQHRQTALVLGDPGDEILDRLLSGGLETMQSLRFAVGLATAHGGLHKAELIHKDLKPANVLLRSTSSEAHLMRFGIASQLPWVRHAQQAPELITGTLLSGTIIVDLSECFSKVSARVVRPRLTKLHCSPCRPRSRPPSPKRLEVKRD